MTPAPHPQCRDIDVWSEYQLQCLYEDYLDNTDDYPVTFEQFKANYDPTTE